MPDADDQREALVNALLESRFFESHDWAGTGSWPGEEYVRWEIGELADDVLAALRRWRPSSDIGLAEAPEQTEEERVENNLWTARHYAGQIEELISVRAQLKAGLAITEQHEISDSTRVRQVGDLYATHPLGVQIEKRIVELREQIALLI